ncbi:uncharacterized protein LOC128669963 [Plodia interpunctella]|uniref:uncharacterized protein LOC128669963 n=1 Tax=Plodia interpunctella TaxID=58824 RepID=UPI0023684E19|nr:uncharacterized protein LOC128669963 [Plodia interpunctella]XP_053601219.1 uncharacterized protein LOC128669963 [Plodia interpunctella]XP_053601220.1 uncharacterized protein LOC128669963 [Plodia interpunctella]
MNQYQTERRLCWCYGILAILLSISVICIAIPYNHWRPTLDVCLNSWIENANCGCIFYGVSTSQYFNGGHNSYCLYAVFAPIPLIVYAIVMVLFHMYRVCINNVGQYEDEKSTAMEEIEGEAIVVTTRTRVSQRNDAVIYCWIPTACIAAVLCLYNLIHASIITDGFLKTCNQYRSHLGREIHASGDQITAIHFRLTCQAIFDFMDYLLRNTLQSSASRAEFINTGLSLQLALISSWVAVIFWVVIVVYTSTRAYKERDVLTCCGN